MGVSVRLSRSTRVYLPFWLAVPLYLAVVAVWAVIILGAGIVLLGAAVIDAGVWLVRAVRRRGKSSLSGSGSAT